MNPRPRWRIFIMAHNGIHDWMYDRDPDFSRENYTVVNLRREPFEVSRRYDLINQFELPQSVQIGSWWAESEGIYNIYRNGLHRSLDFVGFLHYDFALEHRAPGFLLRRRRHDITRRIRSYLDGKDVAHIGFEMHRPAKDYQQRILADAVRPSELHGAGLNCYDFILRDYNEFFGESRTLRELFDLKQISLCSCFLIDTAHFEQMMAFFHWVIESKRLEAFDPEHRNRHQGILAERYFGVFLIFQYKESLDLTLTHHYDKGLK